MNGNNLLVDTNILIYLLDKNPGVLPVLENKSIYISFISELELLSCKNYTANELKVLNALLNDCIIIDINAEIKIFSVNYRIKNKLKLPDAIIAATAQHLGIPLLTADRDFTNLKNIDIVIFEQL